MTSRGRKLRQGILAAIVWQCVACVSANNDVGGAGGFDGSGPGGMATGGGAPEGAGTGGSSGSAGDDNTRGTGTAGTSGTGTAGTGATGTGAQGGGGASGGSGSTTGGTSGSTSIDATIAPPSACQEGATRCQMDAPVLETCTGGQWTMSPCPSVCTSGACTGTCKPGDKQCGTGNTPQTCSPQGEWTSETPCPVLCSGAGTCTECTPDDTRCGPDNTPQTCSPMGLWMPGTKCPFLCTGKGMCTGECKPSTKSCSGNDAQVCGADATYSKMPCPVPANGSATCKDGACGIKCSNKYVSCGNSCCECNTAKDCPDFSTCSSDHTCKSVTPTIKVTGATYGKNCEGKFDGRDMTMMTKCKAQDRKSQLNSCNGKTSCDFTFSWSDGVGTDPCYLCAKDLRYAYDCVGGATTKHKSGTTPPEAGFNGKVTMTCP